jgi:hypothetical protein
MYGQTNAIDLTESQGGNYLSKPGVYEGKIKSIEAKDTKAGKPALVFSFEGKEVNVTGEGTTELVPNGSSGEFNHYELQQTDPTKAQNQINRIGVMMLRYAPADVVKAQAGVTDWDSYRRFVVNTCQPQLANTVIVFKVVPNVYDPENPGIQFPRYKGAMVKKTDVKPGFGLSDTEKSDLKILEDLRAKQRQVSQSAANSNPDLAPGSDDNPLFD